MILILLVVAPAGAAAQKPGGPTAETPGGPAAQPPTDERANAHALAAIGIRAAAAIAAVRADADRTPPHCQATQRLNRRGTPRQIERTETLFEAHWIAAFARAAQPIIASAAADMQAVPTSDKVLRSGRTAWRRVNRAYQRFGALAPVRYCSEIRDYVRGDFRPTHAMRVAARMHDRAMNWDTTDIDQRMAAAVERLIELGVPPEDAGAFDGDNG